MDQSASRTLSRVLLANFFLGRCPRLT
jgi:hypothetical protein